MVSGVDIGRFRGNFGLQAMQKWADLLTNEREAKGWPRFFPRGRDLLAALMAGPAPRELVREREDALQKDGPQGLELARSLLPKERALRKKLEASFPLDSSATSDLLADLSRRVRAIHDLEQTAVIAVGKIVRI